MNNKAALIEALAQILDLIEIEDEKHDQATKDREIRSYTLQELISKPDELEDFADAPVCMALRAGVRSFGERLFKVATYAEAYEIAEEAAVARGDEDCRANVVDKRWDGLIAKDGAGWYA